MALLPINHHQYHHKDTNAIMDDLSPSFQPIFRVLPFPSVGVFITSSYN